MKVRIFIVDDDPAVAKVLETYLKELIDDFEVIPASNGQEAIEKMAIDVLAAFFLVPGTQTAFFVAVTAWCALFGIWIWWMLEYVNQGLLDPIRACAWVLNFMEAYVVSLIVIGLTWSGAAWLGKTYEDFPSLFENNGLRGYWAIFMIVLKIGIIIVTAHMYAIFYEAAMIERGIAS